MSETVVTVGDRPIRTVNQDIKTAVARGDAVVVRDTRSRHNIGIGRPDGARLRIEGSAGYYCGGLNNGAHLDIERNVGWSVGEAMASGEITVNGYAGMSAGASMRGGLIHIRGDTGPASCPTPDALSRWAVRPGPVPILCGAARSGSPALSNPSASIPGWSSPRPGKWPPSRHCWPGAASAPIRGNGKKSFRRNGYGISKAGTRAHG